MFESDAAAADALDSGATLSAPIIIKRKTNKESSEQKSAQSATHKTPPLSLPPAMLCPCRLVSVEQRPNSAVSTELDRWLSAVNSHYRVVAAVGLPGVGKSTVLSLLAAQSHLPLSLDSVFAVQSASEVCSGDHKTNGIDVFVTPLGRLILLDCPPLMAPSQLVRPASAGPQRPASADLPGWLELEWRAIEQLAFLMSVCHVILVVQDRFADPTLLRLIHLAEMLRPHSVEVCSSDGAAAAAAAAAAGGGLGRACRLLFVHNRSASPPCCDGNNNNNGDSDSDSSNNTISEFYRTVFSSRHHSSMTRAILCDNDEDDAATAAADTTAATAADTAVAAAADTAAAGGTGAAGGAAECPVDVCFLPELPDRLSNHSDHLTNGAAAAAAGVVNSVEQRVMDFRCKVDRIAASSAAGAAPAASGAAAAAAGGGSASSSAITEQQWLHHAAKMWHLVANGSQIKEFVHLSL